MEELIIRFLQGRTTPDEEERLGRWREEAPENHRRFHAVAELWALTAAGAPEMQGGTPPDVELLIERAEADESLLSIGNPTPSSVFPSSGAISFGIRTRRWVRPLLTGAMAASLVAVGFGLSGIGESGAPSELFSGGSIVTGAGEMTTLTLGDGSNIRLGPRSSLHLSQDHDGVMARLSGRAFFGVERDGHRKFRVITDRGEAEVLGTRFEVRSEDDEFRVLVVDGRVHVSAGGEALDLTAEQMSHSASDGPLLTTDVDDVFRHLDWMGNSLVFQGTRLDRAIAEIERRYGVSGILETTELARLTVTATFTDQGVENVVMVLCETVAADCSVEEDRFWIR